MTERQRTLLAKHKKKVEAIRARLGRSCTVSEEELCKLRVEELGLKPQVYPDCRTCLHRVRENWATVCGHDKHGPNRPELAEPLGTPPADCPGYEWEPGR